MTSVLLSTLLSYNPKRNHEGQFLFNPDEKYPYFGLIKYQEYKKKLGVTLYEILINRPN